MTIRHSAFFSLLLGGFILVVLSGCAGGNPYLNEAEDALDAQEYDRALARIDSALVQDSANVDAFLLRAQTLRQQADSTMEPDTYKDLYRRAWEAEEEAVKFDPGVRSDVEGQRTLAFTQESQRGAAVFQQGRKTADPNTYQQAAAHFGAAAATFPDSSGALLNEAFARLNMERLKEDGQMSSVIPILEQYVERAETPEKNAYDILSALYLQNEDHQKAIDLLEQARADLSERPPYLQIGGSRGLGYSGTVQENGASRSVDGTVPGRVSLETEGRVSGSFEKKQEKGQLQIQLVYQGTVVADTMIQSGSATVAADLSDEAPLAELEGRLLNAYNQSGQTEKAMAEYRRQIEANPENPTYRYNYGSLLLQAERYEEAVEQLTKATELEPGNVKAQYNLGAAYINQAQEIQEQVQNLSDSLRSISQAAMEENREPTEEEEQQVNELDRKTRELAKEMRKYFGSAIPPLERARQLADSGDSFREQACSALVTAYVQLEQVEKAQELEQCAGYEEGQLEDAVGGGNS